MQTEANLKDSLSIEERERGEWKKSRHRNHAKSVLNMNYTRTRAWDYTHILLSWFVVSCFMWLEANTVETGIYGIIVIATPDSTKIITMFHPQPQWLCTPWIQCSQSSCLEKFDVLQSTLYSQIGVEPTAWLIFITYVQWFNYHWHRNFRHMRSHRDYADTLVNWPFELTTRSI